MFLNSTRYGLIACRYLVRGYYEGGWLSAPEIAGHYGMNVRALTPSLRQLSRAGILRSRRGGSHPGFILADDPERVSLLDVMLALEGGIKVECCRRVIPELRCDCPAETCSVCAVFNAELSSLRERLAAVSLKDYGEERGSGKADRQG